jgi:hypothetical protein
MTMTYACLTTVPATGAKITMVSPGQFRVDGANAKSRELMRDHGYSYDRKAKLWS